jgi:hypothetical protein
MASKPAPAVALASDLELLGKGKGKGDGKVAPPAPGPSEKSALPSDVVEPGAAMPPPETDVEPAADEEPHAAEGAGEHVGTAEQLCGRLFDAIDQDNSGAFDEAEGKQFLTVVMGSNDPEELDYLWADLTRTDVRARAPHTRGEGSLIRRPSAHHRTRLIILRQPD